MDQKLFHFINERWTHPALDLFMAALSNFDIWKPLLILIVLYVFFAGGFKGRAFLFCVLISLLIANAVVVDVLKETVGRKRPKHIQTVRLIEQQRTRPAFLTIFHQPRAHYSTERDRKRSGPSFPSGHVMNNVIIATTCALFFPRWGWLYFFVAGAIGYSRIYLGAHWPSDVVATAFIAAAIALLVIALAEALWKWAGPKWQPRLYARHPRLLANSAS